MASHLSADQIELIKEKLQSRFEILQNEIHDHLKNSGIDSYVELAGKVHDRAEESVAELFADLNYNVTEVQVKELQAIEEAIARIGGGDYGRCVDCDVDIPFERLSVEPGAIRCVDCQQAFEQKA